MSGFERYLVELHRPQDGWGELQSVAARARAAAEQLRAGGTPVRFLRSLFVPEDETCFLLFEGESRGSVRRVVAHAGLGFGGFVQTLSSSDPREVER